jgi:hypothetical protein
MSFSCQGNGDITVDCGKKIFWNNQGPQLDPFSLSFWKIIFDFVECQNAPLPAFCGSNHSSIFRKHIHHTALVIVYYCRQASKSWHSL